MESHLGESLIGAKQQLFAAAAIRRSNQEILRIALLISQAAFQFIKGIDGLALDSRDKEQTQRTEEVNNIGSSLPLAMPSKSEPSASDSDGHGARVIPPSNHTVLEIVDDTNGSAVSRPSIGSHDYNIYGETHQATGYDDSNPRQSLLLSIGSDHAVTSNSVPGHVGPYDSRSEHELPPLSIDANNVTDQTHHGTRVATSDWIFAATGLGFEAVSAFFDQFSSPQKPDYALYGMLLSIVAVLVCTLDIIHNALKQRRLASANNLLWGILPEVFGLALACIQCISSALQFSFLCRNAVNPVKVSLVPFLFFIVLFAFKYRNGRN